MNQTDRAHALELDAEDPLRSFRDHFHFPQRDDGRPVVYLCGNSLGLQPRGVADDMQQELEDWAQLGVDGHFGGRDPWYSYHEKFSELLAPIVGAKSDEVVVMNSLTTNLHLMMVSFYRPGADRYKILLESGAFPSDQYAVKSQAHFHGFDPDEAIVELAPREGERTLRDEDILASIEEHGNALALIMLGGVNYYTGQVFDFERITARGHDVGAVVGFDLAHAAGNVPLELHDWGVDFAAWCSYKYLNAGPGAIAGCFVHERFADAPELPRFAGWWGNDPSNRFEMRDEFVPQHGAGGWQLSNAPVFSMTPLKSSLNLFDQAGMHQLRDKSLALTDYALDLIAEIPGDAFELLTPTDPARRGCQLSLLADGHGRALYEKLEDEGVVCDYREPDVIRIAPVPLYNSFEDVWEFCDILRRSVTS